MKDRRMVKKKREGRCLGERIERKIDKRRDEGKERKRNPKRTEYSKLFS